MARHPDRLHYERPAHEEAAEAEALFTSIGEGAISTDEFGRITRINPVAQELLGYNASELVGEWFPKKIRAIDEAGKPLNVIDRPITRAFLTGRPISEKMYYYRKNGDILPVAISISPIIVDDNPIGAIQVFRDITLEQEVDRMKSEFISLASHQLRTPLSAIKTYAHMLIDGYMGEMNATQRQSLHTIISATNRMNELISTLLNITRMESGTIAVQPKLLRVDHVCADVIKELGHLAGERGIHLLFNATPAARQHIRTDSFILKEILTNLVTNGIKYTPENGSVELTVRARKNDMLIVVRDTGWGIPKSSQDQIFSKFFRAQNIVKRETTGTGLGLYLVKGLVDALGGKIWFKSSEGEGTVFYIALPRTSQPAKKTAPDRRAMEL